MKNFGKCINHEKRAVKIPRLSAEKVKADIFGGPEIRQLEKDPAFNEVWEGNEK